ncbi:MAG: hypothetical protein AVDCRST_MAG40-365, partial [uncultured Gemmatimonadaceae bacterium]
ACRPSRPPAPRPRARRRLRGERRPTRRLRAGAAPAGAAQHRRVQAHLHRRPRLARGGRGVAAPCPPPGAAVAGHAPVGPRRCNNPRGSPL